MAEAEALAQGAVERLLEDEALRGNLTDDGFAPLVDWATAALSAAAARAAGRAGTEAQGAMDAGFDAVKSLVAAVVQAAQGHTRADILALLREPLLARNFVARMRVAAVGTCLGDDADENAARLARCLRDIHP